MEEITLILNACEKRIQFILLEDTTFLFAEETEPQKGGTDNLILSIQNACKTLSLLPQQIKKIASVQGPGNFMGIRLTATIAAALARTNQSLQANLNFMELLAYNFVGKDKEKIHIVTSATKDLIHSQIFEYQNTIPHAISDLQLIPFSQLPLITCDYILGSGIRTDKINISTLPYFILPQQFDNPSINAFCSLIKTCIWQKNDISPIYLKECDAIQNLKHIAEQQGRNPTETRQELERLLKA